MWGKKIKQNSKILQRFLNLIGWFVSKANPMPFWVCQLQGLACFEVEEYSLLKTQFVFQKRWHLEKMKFVKLLVVSVRGATCGGGKYNGLGAETLQLPVPHPDAQLPTH